MKMPKGFLFDFDGVVVNSFKSHHAAWASAFYELFKREIPQFPLEMAGKSPMRIANYYCSTIDREDYTKKLYDLKDLHLDKHFITPRLLPGILEITSFLRTENIPYGIASNATKQFLKNSVTALNLSFTKVFGVEDYEHPKPAPEAYITLAKAIGFTAKDFKELWVFEDSLTGITAAKSAGMNPIGILTQYSEEALSKAGSSLVFQTILEAYHYLIKTNP